MRGYEIKVERESSMKRIFCEGKFRHDVAADEMFLDDAFQNFRRAGMIPGAFRINDGDGAACADAEAAGLGAIDERVGADEF